MIIRCGKCAVGKAIEITGSDNIVTNCELIADIGVSLNCVSNVEISRNKIRYNSARKGIEIIGSNEDIILHNNMITLIRGGVIFGQPFRGISCEGDENDHQTKNLYIYYNSVYLDGDNDDDTAFYMGENFKYAGDLIVKNNIFYNNRERAEHDPKPRHAIYFNNKYPPDDKNKTDNIVFNYNLYFSHDSDSMFYNAGDLNFDDWKTGTGFDIDSPVPKAIIFKDEGSGNLQFADKVENIHVFCKGTDDLGFEIFEIKYDYFGAGRIVEHVTGGEDKDQQYDKPDIGAYEYQRASSDNAENIVKANIIVGDFYDQE